MVHLENKYELKVLMQESNYSLVFFLISLSLQNPCQLPGVPSTIYAAYSGLHKEGKFFIPSFSAFCKTFNTSSAFKRSCAFLSPFSFVLNLTRLYSTSSPHFRISPFRNKLKIRITHNQKKQMFTNKSFL